MSGMLGMRSMMKYDNKGEEDDDDEEMMEKG